MTRSRSKSAAENRSMALSGLRTLAVSLGPSARYAMTFIIAPLGVVVAQRLVKSKLLLNGACRNDAQRLPCPSMKPYLPLLREARPPYRKVSRLYYVPVGLAYGLGLGSIAFGTSFWGGLMFLAI